MQVAKPKDMRFFRRGVKLPIKIDGQKPYLDTKVVFADGTEKLSKLVIDLGAGHFLSMENLENKAVLQKNAITANLGMTVTGFMNGTVSRIKQLDLGKYKMKDVITSFPDFDENLRALSAKRDGNLGIAMLKKFDIIISYPDSVLYLKPGLSINKKDEHDMSGLVYYTNLKDDFKHIIIHKVEEGSAADVAGLQPNDEIVSINFKPVSPLSMQQIDNLFKSADGRSFMLGIFRDHEFLNVMLTLKRRI
ncbi:PDZ domain-containing protein [Mucilaginibacter antarcticus]